MVVVVEIGVVESLCISLDIYQSDALFYYLFVNSQWDFKYAILQDLSLGCPQNGFLTINIEGSISSNLSKN